MDFLKACVLFTVILGLVSLVGTIINNGIVLIDRIETNRAEGSNDYDAVVSAAGSRFRPIMMSMTTTVLGRSFLATLCPTVSSASWPGGLLSVLTSPWSSSRLSTPCSSECRCRAHA